jgi:hypothetical protein
LVSNIQTFDPDLSSPLQIEIFCIKQYLFHFLLLFYLLQIHYFIFDGPTDILSPYLEGKNKEILKMRY